MSINFSIKKRLTIVVLLQVFLVAILTVGYFSTRNNISVTAGDRVKVSQEMQAVRGFAFHTKDYVNGVISFDEFSTFRTNVSNTIANEAMTAELQNVWKNIEKIDKFKRRNQEIDQQVMSLTNKSISQSNQFINSMSKALADEVQRRKVSTLERLVIAGANANNNNNFTIQVLFKELKTDISKSSSLQEMLGLAIQQAEKDVTLLKNTPFAQLPIEALNANREIKSISTEYAANIQGVLDLEKSIIEHTNHLNDMLVEQENRANAEALAAAKRSLSTVQAVIMMLLVISIITVAISFALSRVISSSIEMLISNLNRLKDGFLKLDLSAQSRQSNEFGLLNRTLANFVSFLQDMVEKITMNSDNLLAASLQLSSESQHLSQGATEQAASAEEVSSSLEQLSANIQQNTSSAQLADKIAVETEEGVVSGVNAAGEAISYTNQISSKIKIVRDIAFQTNILALNAAVEAARAGDHGRGFAVVAAEVRKLAERSAKSAQEIESMASNLKTASDNAGEKLTSVIPKVQNNLKLIQEIAAASLEQSTGTEQINTAIVQLNQVTQRNATSSEELATSAEELRDIIGFFKLDRGGVVRYNKEEFIAARRFHNLQSTSGNSLQASSAEETLSYNPAEVAHGG